MKKVTTKKGQTAYRFTAKERQWILQHYRHMTDKELITAFNEQFGGFLTFSYLRDYKYKHGIIKQQQIGWTPEQVQFLLDNYQTKGNLEIAEHFGWSRKRKKGEKKVWKKMGQMCLERTPEQILKIRKENSYTYPDGTIWKDCNGRWRIKHNGEQVFYARWVWEKQKGPIPDGYFVSHKNGNPDDCRIFNLELLTKEGLAKKGIAIATKTLSTNWIAGSVAKGDREFKEALKQHPELIELQRQKMLLNRNIKQNLK